MKKISIGKQDFASLRENDYFYIDKTPFIKEWWESATDVTLITRPRRFGKTLNMSMLECFFSLKYAGRADLFEGLSIWDDKKYQDLQGSYPVIFLSFAAVKTREFSNTRKQICTVLARLYEQHRYLLDADILSPNEKADYLAITDTMDDAAAALSLQKLMEYMERYYKKKVIILLDEYDTPMQEAYLSGYWDELVSFIRSLFNATFKTNPYLERAIMTGITRVSKESIFSDLNNLDVVTTTSEKYETSFGFTEDEVFDTLDAFQLSDKKTEVKNWYDGFIFGKQRDIYNPWSITNFLDKKKISTYWTNTSSNSLIGSLIQQGSTDVKETIEDFLKGKTFTTQLDEQIVFNQLEEDETAIWSLMVASGYLNVLHCEFPADGNFFYELGITNQEVLFMFKRIIRQWFQKPATHYNDFIKALLLGDLDAMNEYMNKVALQTFSSFDMAKGVSAEDEPERLASCCDQMGAANGSSLCGSANLQCEADASQFYHGFVLGLIVELSDKYHVTSNRESGFGRYDVLLKPRDKTEDAIIIEFKVHKPKRESSLEETVQTALGQIQEKRYDEELLAEGYRSGKIRHYGFAFRGKEVLIG